MRLGDAVIALFGAPVAHEDDPERAVRAALAVRDALLDEGALRVRIGITTGEVLVSLGARPSEGEGMALARVLHARRLVGEGRRDEADAELERALAFFRSVGARRYIREAESLIVATA